MKKFTFRFDRLLRLRKSRELEQARILRNALVTYRECMASLSNQQTRRDVARRHACGLPALTVAAGALENLYRAIDNISAGANILASGVRCARETVDAARTEYEKARRDRYTLERLRERRRQTWRREVARQEQREFDEIAAMMAAGRYR